MYVLAFLISFPQVGQYDCSKTMHYSLSPPGILCKSCW